MLNTEAEKTISRLMLFGLPAITILVAASSLNDPVNVPKFLALGIVAVAAFLVVAVKSFKMVFKNFTVEIAVASLFILFAINSVINSDSPIVQNLYGSFGRNTGFLTYLFLVFLYIAALALRSIASFKNIIIGFLIAGVTNVIYCFWAWHFGDFIKWNNPYNTILGTFGNPNFIGAFLGIFVSITFALVMQTSLDLKWRLCGGTLILLALAEIKKSHAVQGIVVTASGLSIVLFYYIKSRTKNRFFIGGYISICTILGIYALLGALQKGPLVGYIYKTSVSLRGEYWQAGWNMGMKFPLTGVGMDSYGDWYRRARDAHALILPGPSTVTNAAHNIPLDLLSYGGWPLFITYLLITLLSLIALIRVSLRNSIYDPIFVSLAVGWIAYQIQSLISINQIGLAIWGWIFGGALISYEIATRATLEPEKVKPQLGLKKKPKAADALISPQLLAGLGMVVGLLIALPPLNSDAKWRSALLSANILQVEKALVPSYLQPMDSYKLNTAVQLFESNKLYDLAHKYSQEAIVFNPNSFDSWRMIYFLTNSTDAEKEIAAKKLRELDPLNPDVLQPPN
jgi:hypothetical protein